MGFRQKDSEGRGGYARIWTIEDKGNYSIGKVSTSKKKKDESGYETDFQDGFVRFVGSAHEKVKGLDIPNNKDGNPVGVGIQISSCDVTTPYDAEKKKSYTNYVIFAFDFTDSNTNSTAPAAKSSKKSTAKASSKAKKQVEETNEEDDDLPF